jgi:glycosyltransferase involved in cell wall biosynthesis
MIPLVSIIIPTYNRAEILSETLDSVAAQTMQNFEAIICDDGSTDDIESIVKSYDKRFRIVRLQHKGLPAIARNAGIISARGQFLAFLDSDDIWLPEKLEKQLLFMKKFPDLGLVGTNAYFMRGKEKTEELYFESSSTFHTNIINELLFRNLFICSSVLVKAHLIKKTGLFCEEKILKATEDYDLWMRFAAIEDCGYIAEPLLWYRTNQQQTVRSEQTAIMRAKAHLYIVKRMEKFVQKQFLPVSKKILIKARRNYMKDIIRSSGFFASLPYYGLVIRDSIAMRFY